MGLDMLLQILRTFECLATKITLVRLQRDMYPYMGSYMVALDRSGIASAPLAGQIQIVGTLATDMALANVFLYSRGSG